MTFVRRFSDGEEQVDVFQPRAERLASKRLGHASYSVSVAGIITGVIIAVFVLVLSLDAAA